MFFNCTSRVIGIVFVLNVSKCAPSLDWMEELEIFILYPVAPVNKQKSWASPFKTKQLCRIKFATMRKGLVSPLLCARLNEKRTDIPDRYLDRKAGGLSMDHFNIAK